MWEKELWIAKRISIEQNEFGVDIERFAPPEKYMMNYMPVSSYTDYMQYGEKISSIYRAFVNINKYEGLINVGDRVYLRDGQMPLSELEEIAKNDDEFCNNANYVVKVALPQNLKIRIDFEKR